MPEDRTGKTALVVGSGAAIAAAIALSRKASAIPSSGVISLDEATMNLLIAIAQGIENLNQNLAPGQMNLTVQGYPPNVDDVEITRITINALVTAYQLPDIAVPDGFALIIKAWPTNAGLIYVARSAPDARNVAQVWPLLPNDFVGEAVTNANIFYISGTAVGDFASVLVGHRKGGG